MLRLKAVTYYVRIIFILLLFAFAAGCTVAHIPKPDPINSGAIPSLQSASSVSLVNAQNDTTVRDLGRAGFGTMTGDLHAWTEAAIELMKTEIEKAGLKTTQADAAKSLKVSIVEAKLGVSGIEFVASVAKCRVRMRVETGSGYVKDESYENNALAPLSACDKAVSQAVQSVLNSEQIVAYLRQ